MIKIKLFETNSDESESIRFFLQKVSNFIMAYLFEIIPWNYYTLLDSHYLQPRNPIFHPRYTPRRLSHSKTSVDAKLNRCNNYSSSLFRWRGGESDIRKKKERRVKGERGKKRKRVEWKWHEKRKGGRNGSELSRVTLGKNKIR